MDDIVVLRCKYCGAPFDEADVKSDSPYISCKSCGTSQQRMDAKAYLDQLMGQVQSWISSAIPSGFTMSASQNVDPVARASIFNRDVKPKIELEFTDYRFNYTTLLSKTLLILPYSVDNSFTSKHTSTVVFEFNAKIRSVSSLAVDGPSQELVSSAAGITQSYAMAINNLALLAEEKDGRFTLMANNFNEAARALKGCKGYEFVEKRFEALATICSGIEMLMNGDSLNCQMKVEKGRNDLIAIKDEVFKDMQFGIMFRAIDQEISTCNILLDLMESVKLGSGDVLGMLNILKRIKDITSNYPQNWEYLLGNNERNKEVFTNISEAIAGKSNKPIPISAGSGDILVPFWEADLRYSFVTGSLWAKKSVEVKEDLLIFANFETNPGCFSNPSSGITDIFRIRPEKNILDGLKGVETSISAGEGIGKIHDSVSNNLVGNRKIMLPVSTKKEAAKLAEDYLARCTSSDNKLKLSKPAIIKIIYVPCKLNGNNIIVPDQFGHLTPGCIAAVDIANQVVL